MQRRVSAQNVLAEILKSARAADRVGHESGAHDRITQFRGRLLQPRGYVHHVADCGVLPVQQRAHLSEHDFTRMQPDADRERLPAARGQLFIQSLEVLERILRRFERVLFRVGKLLRSAEESKQAVC